LRRAALGDLRTCAFRRRDAEGGRETALAEKPPAAWS
jgi:hypothetical protein